MVLSNKVSEFNIVTTQKKIVSKSLIIFIVRIVMGFVIIFVEFLKTLLFFSVINYHWKIENIGLVRANISWF